MCRRNTVVPASTSTGSDSPVMRGLIHGGKSAQDQSVRRHRIARTHAHDFTFSRAIRHRLLPRLRSRNAARADSRQMQQAVNRLVGSEHAAVFENVTDKKNDRDHAADDILLRHETRDHRERNELVHVKLGVRESLRAKTKQRVAKDRKRGDDRAEHRPCDREIDLIGTQPAKNSAQNQADAAEKNKREPPFHSASRNDHARIRQTDPAECSPS